MKLLTGTVTSTKMTRTAAVEVTRRWLHPIYKKTVKRSKKYLVHDEKQITGVGDTVTFKPCRPISKRKHFMLVAVTHKAPISLTPQAKKEKTIPASALTKKSTAKKRTAKKTNKKSTTAKKTPKKAKS